MNERRTGEQSRAIGMLARLGLLWRVVITIGYSSAGVVMLVGDPAWRAGTALADPVATWLVLALCLGYGPLALVRRLRRWLWLAMFVVIPTVWLSQGYYWWYLIWLGVHILAFDPGWVAANFSGVTETLFYDGGCGLCHRWVRLVLAHDREETAFRFAPLQSTAFMQSVPIDKRTQLPDSIVVRTDDGQLLSRTTAVVHILSRLGGIWRVIGMGLFLVPRPMRDLGYDFVAKVRHHFFAPPPEACPVVPVELRKRFEGL